MPEKKPRVSDVLRKARNRGGGYTPTPEEQIAIDLELATKPKKNTPSDGFDRRNLSFSLPRFYSIAPIREKQKMWVEE